MIHVRCSKDVKLKKPNIIQEKNVDFVCNKCYLLDLPFSCCEKNSLQYEVECDDNLGTGISDIDPNEENISNPRPSEAGSEIFECFKRKGLHIIHVNSRSIIYKMEEIKVLALKTKAAVICITETWLDNSVINSEIEIPGYNVIRKDRNKNGGGVCMYIKTCLAFNQRTDLEVEKLEAIWCEILLPKTKPIVIGCCYRPPKQNNFIELLEECISKICYEMEVVILGDMNVCVFKKIGYLYKKYMNTLKIYGMLQLTNEITRETRKSATILDHIICSKVEKISQHGVLPIGISDHYVTYCTRKIVRECINKHNSIKIRSMKTYNVQVFNEKLSGENWNNVYNAETVDQAWNNFKDIVVKVLDEVQ